MSSILMMPPALEPLALAEAKNFLRVEHDADDALIASLIAAARQHIERVTGRALITQHWRAVRDAWPEEGRMVLAPAPLQALEAVRVYDAQSVAHGLDLQAFVIDIAASAIVFAPWSVAVPGRMRAGIEIDFRAGYGDAATDVPEPLRQAIRMLTAHWYDNRGVAAQAAAVLPLSIAALIAPYRVVSL